MKQPFSERAQRATANFTDRVQELTDELSERVRAAVLIADRSAAPSAALRYTDAPQSAAFFEGRDSATVRVPWDMTVAEFLSLYHLENNASARASLERELGAIEADDVLREGDEITIRLTATRGAGG